MLYIPEYREAGEVFRFFEEIAGIPHGSGNTALIADYLVAFAKERGLAVLRDEYDNVVIKKPATAGYESRPTVVIQGHLDMVADKTPDCTIDMEREGLELYRDGDFIRARGTTLGGDDGVAVAYALALLDSRDIPHPRLEALFTSDEEIGLIGAGAVSPDAIEGRLLINIDSDVEGIFTVGCAGGMRSDITLPVCREAVNSGKYTLKLSGFLGGHSGVEIDKGRVNAIKALTEILSTAGNIRIASLSGGVADNAIPKSAECELIAPSTELLLSAISAAKEKYRASEPEAYISLESSGAAVSALTARDTERVISLLSELPSGVMAMSSDIEGLVETSLNLGILKLTENALEASFSVRSAVGKEKRRLGDRLRDIAAAYGADYSERGEYPAWEYRRDSQLREVMVEVYEKMYAKSPEVVIIHAGLECGILSEKFPGLDCVSIGPDNFDIHTPDEHLSISSTARVWEYLKAVLKSI